MDEALIRRITEEVIAILMANGVKVKPSSEEPSACFSGSNKGIAERCSTGIAERCSTGLSCGRTTGCTLQNADRREIYEGKLITEETAIALSRTCAGSIRISKKTIVTPSAWDIFRKNKVNVEREGIE